MSRVLSAGELCPGRPAHARPRSRRALASRQTTLTGKLVSQNYLPTWYFTRIRIHSDAFTCFCSTPVCKNRQNTADKKYNKTFFFVVIVMIEVVSLILDKGRQIDDAHQYANTALHRSRRFRDFFVAGPKLVYLFWLRVYCFSSVVCLVCGGAPELHMERSYFTNTKPYISILKTVIFIWPRIYWLEILTSVSQLDICQRE